MTFQWHQALFAASILALAGCTSGSGSPTGPDSGDLRLSLDRASYTSVPLAGPGTFLTHGFTLIATFSNQGAEPVYLARCFPSTPIPIYSIRLVDFPNDALGSAYSPVWACVGHDQQILVPPGSTRTDTLLIAGPNGTVGVTHEPLGALSGEMHLSYRVQSCPGDGQCPIPEAGLSPAFSVILQP